MKKKEKWQQLKKKLNNAVFIELVIWIAVIGLISGATYTYFYFKFIKPNLYTIYFKDTDGLIKGSPIRFMGIVCGHVRELKYHKDSIEVQMIITKKGVKIPSGSVASVEFSGIAGSKSIEIMPPKNNLSDIGIVTKDTLRLTDVLDEYMYIGKAFASLKDFVDAINQDTILKVFSAIDEASPILKNADKTVSEGSSKYHEFNRRVENIIESEKKLEKTLDKININTKKIDSYLKK